MQPSQQAGLCRGKPKLSNQILRFGTFSDFFDGGMIRMVRFIPSTQGLNPLQAPA